MAINLSPPARQIVVDRFGGMWLQADPRSLPLGASRLCHDIDFFISGIGPRPGLSLPITSYTATPQKLTYLKSAWLAELNTVPPAPLHTALAWDSALAYLYAQDISNPAEMDRVYTGLLSGSRALSETIGDREYVGLSGLDPEGFAGNIAGIVYDKPFTYRPANTPLQQRISQGGPGATPTATFSNTVGYPSGSLAAGPRYLTCMFLTLNGYLTPMSPPRLVTVPAAMNTITLTGTPTPPTWVQAIVYALTLPNAGIGGPYFYLATAVKDNSGALWPAMQVPPQATPVVLQINDVELADGINVTKAGNNRIQVRSVGEFIKPVQYAGRCFYLGERAKIDQFLNMDFYGGNDNSGNPTGWALATPSGTTFTSSQGSLIFNNPTATVINPSPGAATDFISQGAALTVFQTPILDAELSYSVRIVASVNAPGANQKLIVDTYSPTLGGAVEQRAFTLTGTPAEYLGTICPRLTSVPSDLILRVWIQNHAPNSEVTVNQVQVYTDEEPAYASQLSASYIQDYESVDSITGAIDISEFSSDPVTNAWRFLNSLYICTKDRTFQTTAGNAEPSDPESPWDVQEVANASGCIGPMAQDAGEEFSVIAESDGVYVFDGGNHVKISEEIQPLWEQIYWPSAYKIWVRLDLRQQRILIGVPMVTPNLYLPDAPANATPAECNVVIEASYLMIKSGSELADSSAIRVSSFTGQLLDRDMCLKWNAWYMPANYSAWIQRPDGSQQLWITEANANIYKLDATVFTDNGAAIVSRWMGGPYPSAMEEQGLQLGSARKIWGMATALVEGSGKLLCTGLRETPSTPYPVSLRTVTLANPALDDTNIPMNLTGNRLFLDFKSDGVAGTWWKLMRLIIASEADPKMQVTGK